jgi:hypothetical protein
MQERDDSYDFRQSVTQHQHLISLLRTGDAERIEQEWADHVGIVIGNIGGRAKPSASGKRAARHSKREQQP